MGYHAAIKKDVEIYLTQDIHGTIEWKKVTKQYVQLDPIKKIYKCTEESLEGHIHN